VNVKAVRWIVAALCVVLLAGCSLRRVVVNDVISPQGVTFIQSGSTTMQQVVSRLGVPQEIYESEFGMATVYEWSDTKSSAIDFGYIVRAFSPYSPSMTLARTGIDKEEFHVYYDTQGVVRTIAFTRHEGVVPVLWFWPF
jgi:outer membrane protein assembly factor BamE (lipoprotein component of BamABCDE complex)